ncbi:hypothetical protein PAPYR_9302 [Paratrimastix pyriformis]|uniref:Uncharacterized protein n=1 Tax=Paratrimastix pyriformis TaxID=342808 RepID=A0ABQ8UDH3_9EUKA|nr:hypothetical protein PAPYR_9302 [Paratrimastix pyriformis]
MMAGSTFRKPVPCTLAHALPPQILGKFYDLPPAWTVRSGFEAFVNAFHTHCPVCVYAEIDHSLGTDYEMVPFVIAKHLQQIFHCHVVIKPSDERDDQSEIQARGLDPKTTWVHRFGPLLVPCLIPRALPLSARNFRSAAMPGVWLAVANTPHLPASDVATRPAFIFYNQPTEIVPPVAALVSATAAASEAAADVADAASEAAARATAVAKAAADAAATFAATAATATATAATAAATAAVAAAQTDAIKAAAATASATTATAATATAATAAKTEAIKAAVAADIVAAIAEKVTFIIDGQPFGFMRFVDSNPEPTASAKPQFRGGLTIGLKQLTREYDYLPNTAWPLLPPVIEGSLREILQKAPVIVILGEENLSFSRAVRFAVDGRFYDGKTSDLCSSYGRPTIVVTKFNGRSGEPKQIDGQDLTVINGVDATHLDVFFAHHPLRIPSDRAVVFFQCPFPDPIQQPPGPDPIKQPPGPDKRLSATVRGFLESCARHPDKISHACLGIINHNTYLKQYDLTPFLPAPPVAQELGFAWEVPLLPLHFVGCDQGFTQFLYDPHPSCLPPSPSTDDTEIARCCQDLLQKAKGIAVSWTQATHGDDSKNAPRKPPPVPLPFAERALQTEIAAALARAAVAAAADAAVGPSFDAYDSRLSDQCRCYQHMSIARSAGESHKPFMVNHLTFVWQLGRTSVTARVTVGPPRAEATVDIPLCLCKTNCGGGNLNTILRAIDDVIHKNRARWGRRMMKVDTLTIEEGKAQPVPLVDSGVSFSQVLDDLLHVEIPRGSIIRMRATLKE